MALTEAEKGIAGIFLLLLLTLVPLTTGEFFGSKFGLLAATIEVGFIVLRSYWADDQP